MSWAFSASFIDGDFQLTELVLWKRATCLAFIESQINTKQKLKKGTI